MRCKTSKKKLHNWLDSSVTRPMPDDVRVHLRVCDECRGFVRHWNSIEMGLIKARMDTPVPSRQFLENIQLDMQSKVSRGPSRVIVLPRSLRFAGALAALILAAFVLRSGLGLSSRGGQNYAGGSGLIKPYAVEHSEPEVAPTNPVIFDKN